jgi:uncharacterized membrane protein YccC
VSARGETLTGRLAAFARCELGPDPSRVRAFACTLVGLLLASATVLIFKPGNGYWTVAFVVLVSSPAIGKSELDALRRVLASLLGGAAAATVVIGAYDLPWLYVLLQATAVGLALFLFGATSIGPAVITGGTTFAVITGANRDVGAAGFIDLAWDRVLQSVVGSGIGAFAQLALWRSDPRVELRRSLLADIAGVQALLLGKAASLGAGRVTRHFELLGHVEARYPAFVRRQAELSLLILDTARLVDQTLVRETLPEGAQARSGVLLAQMDLLVRRCEGDAFAPPPPAPPAPPGAPRWPGALSDTLRLVRRAGLKTALAAFVTLVVLDALQFPAAGGLLACLVIGQQMSTGTDSAKALVILGALVLAMGITLLTTLLAAPNVDDFGSYLVVMTLAFAPTAWMVTGGPRVRIAGTIGTVLLSVGLFGPYRPTSDLEPSARFFVSLVIGLLVPTAVDRLVWPVDRARMSGRRLLVMMRSAADLMGDLDPRVVLAPSCPFRWTADRNLRSVVALRGERDPAPGTRQFARDEETLRLATETQRLLAARVDQARRELAGEATRGDTARERRAWAAILRAEADHLEHDGAVVAGATVGASPAR